MVNQADDDYVIVGRFGRVYGIKGFIHIQSFTEPSENIFSYAPWYIKIKKNWCPIEIHQKVISNERLVVHVKNYLTREDVSFLTNVEIAVPRDVLPQLDTGEIYYHDLIDLTVYNQNNDCLGKIVEILPTGANDVIVISGEKRTLVPLVWDVFIQHVDLTKGLMNIHWDLED